ncbi:MAG: ABC transporter permease [Halobacteriales archaeon]
MATEDSNIGQVDFDAEAAADQSRIPEEYRTEDIVEEHQTAWQQFVEGLLNDKKALIGAFVVLVFFTVAAFAPVLAPYNPDTNYQLRQPPNSYSTGQFDTDAAQDRVWHPLGTNSFGHDILSRIIFGARVSLVVAFATMLLAFSVGTSIGIVAAYYGGWVDDLLMRFVDFQWAFPELILAVGIIAYVGGRGIWNVVLAIGIAYIDDFARLIRGEVLSLREQEFVRAAEAVGMADIRVMAKEILPNALAPLIVQATILIPLAILAEASLSFLGLGVSPTTPTWGIMINTGQQYITTAWWISVFPGFAIAITVLGFNLFGDGLRDIFDVEEEEIENR